MPMLNHHIQLYQKITTTKYLEKVIRQFNKDLQLANIEKKISQAINLNQFITQLNTIVLKLYTQNYDDYLNLLYRVDVAENEILAIKVQTLEETINEISFLIIKREFQKVMFQELYKNREF